MAISSFNKTFQVFLWKFSFNLFIPILHISVKETTACQLAKSEKNFFFGEYVCVRTQQSEHRKASSDYFTLAPVNQIDEVVSQSMIP
jgi:hypothetical protein